MTGGDCYLIFYAARETTPHRVAFSPAYLHLACAPCGIVSVTYRFWRN